MQRAARRHTDQGRVSKRQVVRSEQQRQQLDKRGPAEAFLTTLQERLYNSRNSKCALLRCCLHEHILRPYASAQQVGVACTCQGVCYLSVTDNVALSMQPLPVC